MTSQTASSRGLWLPLTGALLAVAVRLPFLLQAESFFNADEAVEGLMARHVADLPVFFWGQDYKGVPEAYLLAPLVGVMGGSVALVKAVAVVVWAAAVAVLVRLTDRWWGPLAAVIAGVWLAVGPPAFLYWTTSGSPEVAWLTLVFAMLLLADDRASQIPGAEREGGRVLPRLFLWCGVALWIHPVAACGVLAWLLTVGLRLPGWRNGGWRSLRDAITGAELARVPRVVVRTLNLAIAVLSAAFVFTFAGGTFTLGFIRASHPQRSLRTIVVLGVLSWLVTAASHPRVGWRRVARCAAWFALGSAPVWLHVARGGRVGTAVITRYVADMPEVLGGIASQFGPMTAGLRDASNAPLPVSAWLGAVFALALGVAFLRGAVAVVTAVRQPDRGIGPRGTFAALALGLCAALLTVGGTFAGPPSLRYVLPFLPFLMVGAAGAVAALSRRSQLAGLAVVVVTVWGLGSGAQAWYRTLYTEPSARELLACLEGHGIDAASADYWIAYRLTYLSAERVIVVPFDREQDRYAPYRRRVEASATAVRIEERGSPSPAGLAGVAPTCETRTLTARVMTAPRVPSPGGTRP